MTLIQIKELQKSFGSQVVIDSVSLEIRKGEIVGLLGPNGSGKTTLIRLMNGIIAPDKGSIVVDGLTPGEDGDRIRAMSGVLTEEAGLYESMTGLENLQFFASLHGLDPREPSLKQLLDSLGLTPHRDKKVRGYSTGMKKRLSLARALLHQPSLLYLDEPTNGLDPEGIRFVLDTIVKLNRRQGTTILISSHILDQLETVCDRYLFIENGVLIEQGVKAELEERHLGEVRLRVETTLVPDGSSFAGYPFHRAGERELLFSLPDKDQIPNLLKSILKTADLYTAQIENRSLESLYFTIRRNSHERE